MTSNNQMRWVAYAPLGESLGVLPWPLSWSATTPAGEVGAASLSYSRKALRGSLLERSLADGLELALEQWTGSDWVEIPGARYIAVERAFDVTDATDTVQITAPGFGWLLSKIRHAAPSESMYATEGDNKGRRQFIGVNAGVVIKTLLNEYAARLGGVALPVGFDTLKDSNGADWPALNAFWVSRGEALDVTIGRLVDGGAIDVWWTGRTLHAAPPGLGTDKSTTVVLRAGREIAEAASTETIKDLISAQTLHGGEGLLITTLGKGSPMPWGRWEGFASDERVTLEGTALLRNREVLASTGRVRGQHTRDLTPLATILPGVDVLAGEWITATTVTLERVRVASILWRSDSQGLTRSLILNDSLLNAELMRQRRARYGEDVGANGAGTTVTPAVEGVDKRTPAKVLGLTATSQAYLDQNGVAFALLQASWGEVTTATDGTALDVAYYDLAIRRNETGAPWAIVRSTDVLHMDVAGLGPGETWQVRVRARGRYATAPGVWSDPYTITLEVDTVPPPVPSAPLLTTEMGTVRIEWDGETADGTTLWPEDFARVEVTARGVPAGSIEAAGGAVHIVGERGETVAVTLRSVDRTGNRSAESVSATITVKSILDDTDFDALKQDAQITFDSAFFDKMAAQVALFNTAFVGKLSADAINAGSYRGKVFEGATFISSPYNGSPNNITIGNQTLTVNRFDEDMGQRTSISLGGATSDQIMLLNTSGQPLSGLRGDGSGLVSGELSVGSLIVDGDPLATLLAGLARGTVQHWNSYTSSPQFTGLTSLAAVLAPVEAGRRYRLTWTSYFAMPAGARVQLIAYWRSVSGISPTVNDGTIGSVVSQPAGGGNETVTLIVDFVAPATHGGAHFLVAAQSLGGQPIRVYAQGSAPALMTVDDMGWSQRGGTTLWGGTGTAAATQRNGSGAAPAVRSWRGSTVVTDYLHHGYYGGYQRYSMIAAPAQMITDLNGATDIKVEVQLTNHSWWGSSGTAYVGKSTTTTTGSAPASPQTSGGGAVAVTGWGEGATKWVTIPGWTSAHRSATLGEGAGTGTTTYGKFRRSVQWRWSYTK